MRDLLLGLRPYRQHCVGSVHNLGGGVGEGGGSRKWDIGEGGFIGRGLVEAAA